MSEGTVEAIERLGFETLVHLLVNDEPCCARIETMTGIPQVVTYCKLDLRVPCVLMQNLEQSVLCDDRLMQFRLSIDPILVIVH